MVILKTDAFNDASVFFVRNLNGALVKGEQMKIRPELQIHKCSSCDKPLEDDDFTRLGLIVFPKRLIFFDYRCHHCNFKGAYTVPPEPGMTSVDALRALASIISDDDEACTDKFDWDSVQWE